MVEVSRLDPNGVVEVSRLDPNGAVEKSRLYPNCVLVYCTRYCGGQDFPHWSMLDYGR